MKKITDIYREYNIMPILAIHQIRVASVALMICENIEIDLDKDSIIKACLLHDIANIIKFDLTYFPEHNEPQGIDYWNDIKNWYIEKYGNDEHKASLIVVKELGFSDYIAHLVDIVEPDSIEKIREEDNFAEKICLYADNRVTPHGVVSIEERNNEARKRYENHPLGFDENERDFFMKNLREIENQIFSRCKIKPEDVNDENTQKYIDELKNFSI